MRVIFSLVPYSLGKTFGSMKIEETKTTLAIIPRHIRLMSSVSKGEKTEFLMGKEMTLLLAGSTLKLFRSTDEINVNIDIDYRQVKRHTTGHP